MQGNDAGGSKGRIVMSTGSNDNIEFSAQEVPIDGQWYHVVACSERGSGGTTQARTAYKNGGRATREARRAEARGTGRGVLTQTSNSPHLC